MKAVGSVKNSVKNVTNVVTSVPNNIFHTVDSVMDGITKALQVRPLSTHLGNFPHNEIFCFWNFTKLDHF